MEVALRVEDKNLVEVLVNVVDMDFEGRCLLGDKGSQIAVFISLDRHIDLLGLQIA